ncbi:hypothetical protein H1Q59_06840 [Holosporaceae bacterium 'Namur']|nr:hypothetical protein [Holosporaceae bacterium 'Namur']
MYKRCLNYLSHSSQVSPQNYARTQRAINTASLNGILPTPEFTNDLYYNDILQLQELAKPFSPLDLSNNIKKSAILYILACFGEACMQLTVQNPKEFHNSLQVAKMWRNDIFHDIGQYKQGDLTFRQEISNEKIESMYNQILNYDPIKKEIIFTVTKGKEYSAEEQAELYALILKEKEIAQNDKPVKIEEEPKTVSQMESSSISLDQRSFPALLSSEQLNSSSFEQSIAPTRVNKRNLGTLLDVVPSKGTTSLTTTQTSTSTTSNEDKPNDPSKVAFKLKDKRPRINVQQTSWGKKEAEKKPSDTEKGI